MTVLVLAIGWRDRGPLEILRGALPAASELRAVGPSDPALGALVPKAEVIIAGRFPAAVAHRAARLRLLQVNGAGLDGIDLEAVPPGAWIASASGHGREVAAYALSAAYAVRRDLLDADRRLRAGDWSAGWVGGGDQPRQGLEGMRLCVLGAGEIGDAVARLALSFGMEVTVLTRTPARHRDLETPRLSVQRLSGLRSALAAADVLVIALPLTTATEGLVGASELALLPIGATVVNVARAAIVDEQALHRALSSRRLGSAVLDVWYRYPAAGAGPSSVAPFADLDNVLLTPHISAWSDRVMSDRARFIAAQVGRLLGGEPPLNVVRRPGV